MIPLRDNIPSDRFPVVTVSLIMANVVVFVYQLGLGQAAQSFIWKFAAVPASILSFHPVHENSTLFPPLTLVTSQFLHGGTLHLAGNMLFLWIFGDNVEGKLGYVRFLIFYLICGIISGLVQVFTLADAAVPIIGASGAIAGVMGAYFIRFPRAKIQTLIFLFFIIRIIYLPAILFLGIWLVFQIVAGVPTYGVAGGGVAYFAHIGGFVAGMILFKIMEKYK